MHSSNGLLANIKLLASDLDGTLLNPDHRPAPGTFEAIAEYQAAGGTFAVCTGRDLGSARGVLKGLDIDSMPGVYLNGTTVKGKSGESLRAQTLPRSLLLKMVEWGRAHRKQASILFVAGDMHYVMDKSEEHALFMHRHLLDPEPLEVKGGYESAEPEIPSQVSMMRVICSPENMAVIRPEVAAAVAGQAAYAQSLPTTIDIMAPGTNKATGLHVLLQALGLSEAECCAIGDSENDLEMLQSVRVACAMGNAVKKTKAVSHFLLPKNEDDPSGVVCLLRRLTAALRSANATAAPEPWPGAPSRRLRVACFSSGSLGSCVARMVGQSVMRSAQFEEEMTMWVAEDEELEGQKLTEVINATRFDSKHMPGLRLPPNVKATSDAQAAAKDADLLILVVPREQITLLLDQLAGIVKPTATAVVMSKWLVALGEEKQVLRFGSQLVSERLGIPSAVLMGGTLAKDVAMGYFAEATLGCEDSEVADTLLALFNRPNFAVSRLKSPQSVELFAVLKSIISLASGFCDGMKLGSNTKAAVVRLGSVELCKFAARFYPECSAESALKEACGWTDIIASSFGDSRSRRCAAAFVVAKSTSPKTWEEVAAQCLRGGMPSGVGVVLDVFSFIKSHRAAAEFPFIAKVHSIVCDHSAPSTLTDMAVPRVRSSRALKVAVLGSGNWGTAIARIIAQNTQRHPEFHKVVQMWVHEETVDGQPLTSIINSRHENVKYLPGIELPQNLQAEPSAVAAVKGANILVFVLPHKFLPKLLDSLQGAILPDAVAVSLIKGYLEVNREDATLRTGTQTISEKLGINCAVLNGANVASDVAHDQFAEATLGCAEEEQALVLSRLFNAPQFSVRTSPDVLGVELFGGLKNVVALAAGFCDGLGLPACTKAAVLRRGLLEMAALVQELFPSSRPETVVESCGFADLLTTCYSGRNRHCAEVFAKDPSRTWEEIENELLGGQKLQGPSTSLDLQVLIDQRGLRTTFPLFTAIHGAVTKAMLPEDVFTCTGLTSDIH